LCTMLLLLPPPLLLLLLQHTASSCPVAPVATWPPDPAASRLTDAQCHMHCLTPTRQGPPAAAMPAAANVPPGGAPRQAGSRGALRSGPVHCLPSLRLRTPLVTHTHCTHTPAFPTACTFSQHAALVGQRRHQPGPASWQDPPSWAAGAQRSPAAGQPAARTRPSHPTTSHTPWE
jgi:hypothetical protein